jgi:cell division protein FtsB
MQEEVQKALKIHKANKVLQDKNNNLKKEIDRLRQENDYLVADRD